MTLNYRIVAAAAAGLLLLGAVVGVAVHQSSKTDSTTVVSATTQPTQAGAAPTTSPTPTANDTPAVFHLPAVGTYRYHFDRTGADPASYDATDVFAAVRNGFSETRDHQSVTETHTHVLDHGALVETGFSFDSATTKSPCHWSRPLTVIPAKAADGRTWTSSASCTTTVGSSQLKIDYHADSKVVGIRQAKIGNATGPLLRIDRTVSLRTTVKGQTAVRNSMFTQYYDTARGLLAQSIETATDQSPSGTKTYRIVESMLTLQPEVSR